MLKYLPSDYITPDLCLISVSSDGFTLDHVPKYHKSIKMCFAAIKNIGDAIEYVPDEFKNVKMCRSAAKSMTSLRTLKFIPQQFRDEVIKIWEEKQKLIGYDEVD